VKWVILKPCELKNGQTYLRDPAAAPPIEIVVVLPRDPIIKSTAATESVLGCLIQEAFSELAPKSRQGAGPRSSLPRKGNSPLGMQADQKEFAWGIESDRDKSEARLVRASYHPVSASPNLKNSGDPDRDEFLAKKAQALGFSVGELKSAIEAWSKSVEDPYQ
jgi:hypothetical protein